MSRARNDRSVSSVGGIESESSPANGLITNEEIPSSSATITARSALYNRNSRNSDSDISLGETRYGTNRGREDRPSKIIDH